MSEEIKTSHICKMCHAPFEIKNHPAEQFKKDAEFYKSKFAQLYKKVGELERVDRVELNRLANELKAARQKISELEAENLRLKIALSKSILQSISMIERIAGK